MKYTKYIIATFMLMRLVDAGAQYYYKDSYQDYGTISTPNNTAVNIGKFIGTDYTSNQKEDVKSYWMDKYNNIIFVSEATCTYNCHAFAWTGNTNFWMTQKTVNWTNPEVSKYWDDGSYVKVSDPSPGAHTIVFYGTGDDHSASVSMSAPNQFISKWGPAPRFIHHIDDSPYDTSDLNYYERPAIIGPTLICYSSPQPFLCNAWQPGYYWDKSSNLSLSGTTSDAITVSATNSSGAAGWLSVKNSSGVEVFRKDVWVGPPVITIEGWEDVCSYNEYHYVATPTNILSAVSSMAYAPWTVSPSGQVVDIYRINNNHEVMISFLPWAGYYEIQYQVGNACGCGPMAYKYVWAEPCYSPSPPAYPNPVSDILHVEIDPQAILRAPTSGQNTPGVQPAKPDPTFDIRLYNGQGNQVRHTASKGGTVQLNVSNLPNGLYYLHIYREKSRRPPQIQQIIVEH